MGREGALKTTTYMKLFNERAIDYSLWYGMVWPDPIANPKPLPTTWTPPLRSTDVADKLLRTDGEVRQGWE